MSTNFPGKVIKVGEADSALVARLQRALAEQGYGPFAAGIFDGAMEGAVKLFQAQHVDIDGHSLVVDGEVGRYTWGALFGNQPIAPSSAPSTLMLQALGIAGTQVGQMEVPPASNRGPMVDEYLRAASVDPTSTTVNQRAWCMAFVYWAFRTAAASIAAQNPAPRTAGCLDFWNRSQNVPGAKRIARPSAYQDPSLIKPGLVFILDFGHGLGHTGIVERLTPGGRLMTVEGTPIRTDRGQVSASFVWIDASSLTRR